MELPAEIRSLIEGLERRIDTLEARVAELERENAGLRAQNADLKRRLGLDSSTSSKPPSSDGLRKKPVSLREPSGKTSGGQPGHKGDTLKRVADPDRIVVHEARACRHCGAGLRLSMARETETRQVFDLPAKLIEVTEHRRLVYACAGCGGRTGAAFPDGVEAPAQYGERLRAAAVYLHLQQLIPEERTAETLADLIGVPSIAPASVMDWVRRKADALAPVAGRIGALAAAARVRCLDETGFRVAGQTQWLHTIATESLTLYRVSDKRGDVPNVPFTNNLAEQALRMMKVKMKISGAFRTFDAAQDFAALRSVIATARKQGWNILQTLTRDPPALINALPA